MTIRRSGGGRRAAAPRPRGVLALVVGAGLVLGACSGSDRSDSSSSEAEDEAEAGTTTTAAPSPEWARLDQALSDLGPDVGFLAASVADDGTCEPVHEIAASTARPTGSQFKLFVLGALAGQITEGQVSWDQTLTVDDAVKSLGNGEGSLQFAPAGTRVSVEEAATKMISISDNTAADMLAALVGRDDVEAQVGRWTDNAEANHPFLTTRQMLLLHYADGLADRYLATPPDERGAFLASSVDPLPLSEIGSAFSVEPRYVDEIEWFASPDDICRTFAGLQGLSTDPALAPLPAVLSQEVGGIGLDPSAWPTVWFKGGSESGVLTLGWLATNGDGDTFVVEAMVSNPDAALADDSITDLVALAGDAFGLLDWHPGR
jgi:hypothetical protein